MGSVDQQTRMAPNYQMAPLLTRKAQTAHLLLPDYQMVALLPHRLALWHWHWHWTLCWPLQPLAAPLLSQPEPPKRHRGATEQGWEALAQRLSQCSAET